MSNNNTAPINPAELQKVYDEMLEIGEKIEQTQQEVSDFKAAVQTLNEHFADLKKQWDEMYERHKEIYKPSDISELLRRAGRDPENK